MDRRTIASRIVITTLGIAIGGTLGMASSVAIAQDYPNKPVRVINGFAPGGNVELVGRLVAQRMSDALGQPLVIESRPGAGTMVANQYVARQPADGYTLLLVSGAFPTLAATQRKLPYDAVNDFTWISSIIGYPLVALVRADSPYKSLDDLIAAAKAAPGRVTYPSPGVRSLIHLATEHFASVAGVELLHVPFRGGSETMTELMAGRLDVLFETLTLASGAIAGGKVRALAVTAPERVPGLPAVPAVAERFPGFEAHSFIGLAAPRDLPPAIAERLNAELRKALASPEIRQRFAELGGTARPQSPAEMRAFVTSEIARWRQVVEARRIEVE